MTDDDLNDPAPPSPTDEGLDRLLSGGGLSVQEEDAILGNVLAAVRAEEEALATEDQQRAQAQAKPAATPPEAGPSFMDRLRQWWAVPPALAAAAAAFFLWPAPTTAPDGGFQTRGGDDVAAPAVLNLSCQLEAKAIDGCRPGATLVIGWRAPRSGFVTGAALGPDQALVWLFDGERVEGGASFAFQTQLPADLAAGDWQIVLLPSGADRAAPLTRDEARRRLEHHVAQTGAEGPGDTDLVVAPLSLSRPLTTNGAAGAPEAGQP
jgi:hypothetical protein